VRVVEDNENIIFGLTDRGGHLAWLEGWDFWEEVRHRTHDTTRHTINDTTRPM
jgi:predicted alpha/beta-fold hydrolase